MNEVERQILNLEHIAKLAECGAAGLMLFQEEEKSPRRLQNGEVKILLDFMDEVEGQFPLQLVAERIAIIRSLIKEAGGR